MCINLYQRNGSQYQLMTFINEVISIQITQNSVFMQIR